VGLFIVVALALVVVLAPGLSRTRRRTTTRTI
jgi:hypothetical protein